MDGHSALAGNELREEDKMRISNTYLSDRAKASLMRVYGGDADLANPHRVATSGQSSGTVARACSCTPPADGLVDSQSRGALATCGESLAIPEKREHAVRTFLGIALTLMALNIGTAIVAQAPAVIAVAGVAFAMLMMMRVMFGKLFELDHRERDIMTCKARDSQSAGPSIFSKSKARYAASCSKLKAALGTLCKDSYCRTICDEAMLQLDNAGRHYAEILSICDRHTANTNEADAYIGFACDAYGQVIRNVDAIRNGLARIAGTEAAPAAICPAMTVLLAKNGELVQTMGEFVARLSC